MKVRNLAIIGVCLFAYAAPWAQDAKKDNIAIISTKAVDDDWGTLATGEGYLVDFFLKTNRFNVIERSQLDQIMKEQSVQTSGAINEADAVKLGALCGAQFLVLLEVTSVPQPFSMGGGGSSGGGGAAASGYGGAAGAYMSMMGGMKMKMMMGTPTLSLNVRIVGVSDAKILYNKNSSRESAAPKDKDEENRLRQDGEKIVNGFVKDIMQTDIVPDLQAKFPMRGYVIDVTSDDHIEIDLGDPSGIKKGDAITVVKIGAERKHPVTGKILPGTRAEIGKLTVTQVNGETSICKKVSSTEPLVVGQVIEAVPKLQ